MDWPTSQAQKFWDESSAGHAYSVLMQCEAELVKDTIKPLTDALAADSLMSTILGVCEHYRVNQSQFAAWPVADQEKAIAYYLESRNTCPGCGLSKRLRTQYIELGSETCVHCDQIEQARNSIPEPQRHSTHLTIKAEQ